MEFVWRPSKTLGNNNEIFAHLLIDHYRSPTGLDFDILHQTGQWTNKFDAYFAEKMLKDVK